MDKQNPFDAQQHPSQTSSKAPDKPFEDKKPSLTSSPGKHRRQESGSKGSLYLSNLVEQQTHLLVHLLGYGLLLFSLLDYIYILIPPRFTDPNWEFQTIGALVEHAAIPLLGLIFVFYRHQGYIVKREKILLGLLSWVSLLVGLLYLLMLPLGIIDTGRIYHANNAQITAQVSQQNQQIQQVKGKLNQATTDAQLNQIFAALARQSSLPKVENPQALKNQALTKISEAEQNIQVQADAARKNQLKALGKQSLKWNLGALVSGVLFIWVWYLTRWTRIKELPTK